MPAKKPKRRATIEADLKTELKDKGILIRVTAAQKRVLASTAKKAGLGLSSWMLTTALLAAQQARWDDEARRKKKRA